MKRQKERTPYKTQHGLYSALVASCTYSPQRSADGTLKEGGRSTWLSLQISWQYRNIRERIVTWGSSDSRQALKDGQGEMQTNREQREEDLDSKEEDGREGRDEGAEGLD